MILSTLEIDPAEFERRTGWSLKPEGACKGPYCVPLPSLDAPAVAERLGMALVHEERHALWALGPETIGGCALTTADAPDLNLPDWRGGELGLASLRGQKVFLLAWASW